MVSGNDIAYLLVTPVKNEKEHIGVCIESVVTQSIRPALWIIVDDGSTDGTLAIVEQKTEANSWIEILKLDHGEWDLGIHYSEVCIKGFDFVRKRAKEKELSWDFIGLVDGDIKLGPDYCEKMIEQFDRDKELGIASGILEELRNGSIKGRKMHEGLPMGGARLWRKKCYEDAPYIPAYAPDSVSNIKAQLRGWNSRMFPEITAEQLRPMGTSQGRCRGAALWGRSSHYLGSTPIFAFLKGIKLLGRYPFYTGFCYWRGYFVSYLLRKKRIEDPEILDYFRKRRMKDIISSNLNRT